MNSKQKYFQQFSDKELEDQLNVLLTMSNNGGMLADDVIEELTRRYDSKGNEKSSSLQKAFQTLGINFNSNSVIEKSAKGMVGEIREWSGKKYKKQANGKWMQVSDKGLTKREHIKITEDLKSEAKNPKGSEFKYNSTHPAWKEAETHYNIADKLSNKQHSDEEVGLGKDSLEKGAKANTGEIREWSGKKYKKQANGKWLEISESHGMTKREHLTKKLDPTSVGDNPKGLMGGNFKKYHRGISSKLSDKEHSDEEVGIKGMEKQSIDDYLQDAISTLRTSRRR
jgi:hypothetical protein